MRENGFKERPVRSVAVIGLGALGAAYARQILKYSPVTDFHGYVREPESYQEEPVTINGVPLPVACKRLDGKQAEADLIIIAVKSYNMEELLPQLGPLVGPDSTIISLLNGLTSEELLSDAFGEEHVLRAVVMGADLNRTRHSIRLNQMGVLYFGEKKNQILSARVARIKEFFDQCQIPCRVPVDMEREMWRKLMINVGMNQVSTVFEYTYAGMRDSQEAMELMRSAQREVISVAKKKGISLSEDDIDEWEKQLAGLSGHGRSSMLQDFWEKRKLECDILGRYICKAGQEVQVETPVNRRLFEEIVKKSGQ